MPSQVSIVDLPSAEKDDITAKNAAKPSSRSSRSSTTAKKRATATDNELKTRLTGVFDRIADAADARGDEELAEVLREDRDVMASGIVSLTRPFVVLRAPVVLLLAVVEPVMAFGRLARLAIGRVMDSRADRKTPANDTPPV